MTPARTKELAARIARAQHGVQSGVAFEMGRLGEDGAGTSPKHLRVGVSSALVEISAVVRVLVRKGILSEEEYLEALAEGLEEEVATYEAEASARLGTKVSFR